MGSGHSLSLRQSDLLFLKGLENEGETILQRKDDFMIDGTTLNKAVSHRCRQKKQTKIFSCRELHVSEGTMCDSYHVFLNVVTA